MPFNEAEGTQLAVIGTEHVLAALTPNRVYTLKVDTVNMLNGDILELRVKTKVRSTGAENVAYSVAMRDAQADPVKFSIPVPSDISATFTLKQVAGTGRNFDWKVLST